MSFTGYTRVKLPALVDVDHCQTRLHCRDAKVYLHYIEWHHHAVIVTVLKWLKKKLRAQLYCLFNVTAFILQVFCVA